MTSKNIYLCLWETTVIISDIKLTSTTTVIFNQNLIFRGGYISSSTCAAIENRKHEMRYKTANKSFKSLWAGGNGRGQ